VLTLDGPVEEYFPACYQRLFAMRHQGVDYLLSEACEGIETLAECDPENVWMADQRWYGFRRMDRERVEKLEQIVRAWEQMEGGETGG